MDSTTALANGDDFFKKGQFFRAHAFYNVALNKCPKDDEKQLSTIYLNLSQTHLHLEHLKEAIEASTSSIGYNPDNGRAYLARAEAKSQMFNWKEAYEDYLIAQKLLQDDSSISEKIENVKNKMNSAEENRFIVDQVNNVIYDNEFAKKIMYEMLDDRRPDIMIVKTMIKHIVNMHNNLPNIVNVEHKGIFRIVGDTHGQFQDLINIFETFGFPSEDNPYLFNGDFVDRGSMGIEILLTLFAWKLANPKSVYLNRGNHEARNMNTFYGFENECICKYNQQIFDNISDLFETLPLGYIINKKIFVVHGGLFHDKEMTIDQFQKLNRYGEPPTSGPINDILWNDPVEENGITPSPRGSSFTFGPDVTEDFLMKNNFDLLIRSHQVQYDGYLLSHNGKCITIFSAPNYDGIMTNKGAVCKLEFDNNYVLQNVSFEQFEGKPIPEKYQPMKYIQAYEPLF